MEDDRTVRSHKVVDQRQLVRKRQHSHFPLCELHITNGAKRNKGSSVDIKLENAIFVKRKLIKSNLNTNIGYLDTNKSQKPSSQHNHNKSFLKIP
jgi:hypothetical protein